MFQQIRVLHEQYFEQGIGRKGVFKFGHFAARRIAELYRIGSHAAMVKKPLIVANV
jgi:hypothetical protein